MFTIGRAIAMTAAGLVTGIAIGRATAGLRLNVATAPPPAPGLEIPIPGIDVPSAGHPDTLTTATEEFECAMARLRDELFPDRPYILDLQDWLEADI